MSASSSVPRPSGATFLKPAAPKPAAAAAAAASAAAVAPDARGGAGGGGGEKKAGVNKEYDSFMEEMKGLGAF